VKFEKEVFMKNVNTRAILLIIFSLFIINIDFAEAKDVEIPLSYLGKSSDIDEDTAEYVNKGKPKSEWQRN